MPIYETVHPKQRLGLWLLGLDPEHAPPDDIPVNELLFGGAGGGGKSEFDRMVAFRLAEQWPGSKGAVVRKAGPDLIKTQVEPFLSRSPEGDQGWNWRLMRYRFLNGSEVEFHSCYEDLDYLRFRSYDWDWIVFDEATELSEETLTFMRSRAMRSTGKLGWTPKIIYTSNPLGPGNEFFVKTFVDGHPSDGTPWIDEVKLPNGHSYKMKRAFIQSKVQDNPSVPEDEALFGMEFIADPELRRAIRDGDWHLTTDTFFSSFRRNLHVVPHFDIPEGWIVWRGMDWGIRDPAACLWLARNPKAEFLRTYVFREWWQSGLADYQQAKAILALSKDDPPAKITLCDPSAVDQYKKGLGTNHAQEWAAAGLYVTAANNRRPIGWQRIHRALAHGDNWPVPTELQIMDNCPELINQIEHAKRDKDDPEDIKEPRNPTDLRDEYLDCISAGTPILTISGTKPIQSVTPGDYVMTRVGWRKVLACWQKSPGLPCLKLTMSDGRELIATPDHRIRKGDSWVPLDSLRYGDILEPWQMQTSSSSTVSRSAATPTPSSLPTAIITALRATTADRVWAICTSRFGKRRTARSRPATTSTIKTAIRSITRLATWLAYQSRNTAPCTLVSRSASLSSNYSPRLGESLPRPGTIPTLGTPGTSNTPRTSGTVSELTPPIILANSAVPFSPARNGAPKCDSALTPASPHGAALAVLILRPESAPSAVMDSTPTATASRFAAPAHVVAVTPASTHPVWDIQVDDPLHPEFFAGGILVHNCLRYSLLGARVASSTRPTAQHKTYRLVAGRR